MNPLMVLQILEAITGILANLKAQGHPDLVALPAEAQAKIKELAAPLAAGPSTWDADHVGN